MITDWTRNLISDEDKHLFERKFQGAREVLDRLNELVAEREHSMDVSERGLKQFENPNWAYRQAFNNGLRSAFTIVKTLIAQPDQRNDNERPISPR
jgi:hypothetical protein